MYNSQTVTCTRTYIRDFTRDCYSHHALNPILSKHAQEEQSWFSLYVFVDLSK